MNVSELLELTYWIDEEIVEANIIPKYQALHSVLQNNLQPNQQQPFESQKKALISSLLEVSLNRLTKDQLNFLDNLGIGNGVGEEGVAVIEDILYKNVIDVATSTNKVQEIIQAIDQGIRKSNEIKSGLEDCVEEETYEADDEILMRVVFSGNASMSNVTDFKSWGEIWYEIGRGISMAHDLPPENVKIIGATRGSIVIELAVVASIATTASGIILAALKVADKVLGLRMKAEELRSMKLRNKKLAKEIENEAENEKKSGIEEITTGLVKKIGLDKNNQGDKVTALDKAVKNLVNFVEMGGEVDFVMPEEENEGEEAENQKAQKEKHELRVAFQEIRNLENKLSLIEHKAP